MLTRVVTDLSKQLDEQRQLRRARQERADVSLRAITSATITSLAQHGYEGTTFEVVSRASGLSRGALLHHYANKRLLIAGALKQAVDDEVDALQPAIDLLPEGPQRIEAALDLLYELFHGELFQASVAAQVAARVDGQLAEFLSPLFARVYDDTVGLAAALFGDQVAAHPDIGLRVRFVISAVRGLTILDNQTTPRDVHTWHFIRSRLHHELLSR